MAEHAKAVFLSYASQDAEAARRIAEALRGGGIEVFLDQSELRGGDAWIRRSGVSSMIALCSSRLSQPTPPSAMKATSGLSGTLQISAPT